MAKISEVIGGAAAIVKGMGITFGEMLNPTITEDYPGRAREIPGDAFRGVHELQRDENGLEKCVACFLCAAACPAQCIYIEAAENTEELRISGGERLARFITSITTAAFTADIAWRRTTDAITHGHTSDRQLQYFDADLSQRTNAGADAGRRALPLEGRGQARAQRALGQTILWSASSDLCWVARMLFTLRV